MWGGYVRKKGASARPAPSSQRGAPRGRSGTTTLRCIQLIRSSQDGHHLGLKFLAVEQLQELGLIGLVGSLHTRPVELSHYALEVVIFLGLVEVLLRHGQGAMASPLLHLLQGDAPV